MILGADCYSLDTMCFYRLAIDGACIFSEMGITSKKYLFPPGILSGDWRLVLVLLIFFGGILQNVLKSLKFLTQRIRRCYPAKQKTLSPEAQRNRKWRAKIESWEDNQENGFDVFDRSLKRVFVYKS